MAAGRNTVSTVVAIAIACSSALAPLAASGAPLAPQKGAAIAGTQGAIELVGERGVRPPPFRPNRGLYRDAAGVAAAAAIGEEAVGAYGPDPYDGDYYNNSSNPNNGVAPRSRPSSICHEVPVQRYDPDSKTYTTRYNRVC